jgi:hypothetical protein
MAANDVRVVHFLPGRARLKIEALRRNEELAEQIEAMLGEVPGVIDVTASPLTGSVLVHWHTDIQDAWERLVDAGRQMEAVSNNWDPSPVIGRQAPQQSADDDRPAEAVSSAFHDADQSVRNATAGEYDLRTLIPLSLLTFGFVDLIRTGAALTPNWWDYFWWAFATFTALNAGVLDE